MAKRFQWTAGVFAAVALLCGAIVIAHHAVPTHDPIDLHDLRWAAPQLLYGWPNPFRQFMVTCAAAVLCFLCAGAIGWLEQQAHAARWQQWASFASCMVLASLMAGALNIAILFGAGYFGYGAGLWNLVWLLGVPLALGMLLHPRWKGLLVGAVLVPMGFLGFTALCWLTKFDPV